tara:strand:+ start:110 stop:400 length:291 start_codon:yes stop_codon:yes gene_type:complete
MKISEDHLRKIICEELKKSFLFEQAEEEGEAPEAKNKIVKGLEMIGMDADKLKDLPSNEAQLKAFVGMIEQALDTTIAGKAKAAEKKFDAGTSSMT